MLKYLLAAMLFVPMIAEAQSDFAPPKRKRIYIMRHGDVHYFDAQNKPVPNPDLVNLTELGLKQAESAGKYFTSLNILKFDKVYSSTLPRTIQTAEGVLKAMNLTMPVTQIEPLREIKNGSSSKIKTEELEKAMLNYAENSVGKSEAFIGGETMGEMQARIYPAFETIMKDEGGTVLVVLHAVVNTAIVSKLITGKDDYFGKFESGAGCMHIIDVGTSWQSAIIRAYNFCPLSDNYTGARVSTLEKLLLSALKGRK